MKGRKGEEREREELKGKEGDRARYETGVKWRACVEGEGSRSGERKELGGKVKRQGKKVKKNRKDRREVEERGSKRY